MPVCLHLNRFTHDRGHPSQCICDEPFAECDGRFGECLSIGLMNNMADGAMQAAERQFISLLDSASDGVLIRLSLFSLPGVPRGEFGIQHMRQFYSSSETLWNSQLDALIVTGREPLTANLADEPYWDSFTSVLDWAREHTISTAWSCLAAHAAAQYMDGIRRVRSEVKHCGVFDCVRLSEHPLIEGTPSNFKIAHSRWNGLPENELAACGYNVLTRAADSGVDTFVKQDKSLFVFFQGHPEYEQNTLLLEYRRDAGRYLRGETETYPSLPRCYFDRETAVALTAIQKQALTGRHEDLLAEVSKVLENAAIEDTWRPTASRIYQNWLNYLREQKQARLTGSAPRVEVDRNGGLIPVLANSSDTLAGYPGQTA